MALISTKAQELQAFVWQQVVFFSFLSLRSGNIKSQKKSEKIAEYLFITALVMITVAVILLSIKVI